MLWYIFVCSMIGGISVSVTTGLGAAIVTTAEGDNQVCVEKYHNGAGILKGDLFSSNTGSSTSSWDLLLLPSVRPQHWIIRSWIDECVCSNGGVLSECCAGAFQHCYGCVTSVMRLSFLLTFSPVTPTYYVICKSLLYYLEPVLIFLSYFQLPFSLY